jgi:hypothetical protein
MYERIFSSKLCDLYTDAVAAGLEAHDYQPCAVHILRCLALINNNLSQKSLEQISTLLVDEHPALQTALMQLLVDANQESMLSRLIGRSHHSLFTSCLSLARSHHHCSLRSPQQSGARTMHCGFAGWRSAARTQALGPSKLEVRGR